MSDKPTVFAWHVHHDVLMEALTEPIENRINCIESYKPEHEKEVRLRLLRPVVGRLPDVFIQARGDYDEALRAYVEAGRAYDEAGRVYDEAGRVYYEAWWAYDEALKIHYEDIKALHVVECPDCPWDGKTIFP